MAGQTGCGTWPNMSVLSATRCEETIHSRGGIYYYYSFMNDR